MLLYRYLLLIVALFFLWGCGYRSMSLSPIVMPDNIGSLYISKVNNPTIDPYLTSRVKTIVMDELSKRALGLRWTSRSSAKGYLVVDIKDYSKETEIENTKEQTVKSNVCITLRISLYRNLTNNLVWDSNDVQSCESADENIGQDQISKIQDKIIRDIVEKIAIKLSNNF